MHGLQVGSHCSVNMANLWSKYLFLYLNKIIPILQEASNAERLAIEKKKLEEEAKKKAELEEEQRRIAAENAAKK